MTIDNLIEELRRHREQCGGTCRVLVTWEGTVREIEPPHIYPEAAENLWERPEDEESVLLIDPDLEREI